MLLLVSQLVVAQDISIGVDPKPLFDSSSKGGLDFNFSVNVTNSEYEKYGLNGEYFHNIDYASYGIFYDYKFGVEAILNCKYRPDLKFYWDEDKLYPISGRLNQPNSLPTSCGYTRLLPN